MDGRLRHAREKCGRARRGGLGKFDSRIFGESLETAIQGDSIRKTAGGADPSFATRRIIFVADPSLFLCLPGWTPHVRKWRIVFADDPSRASLPYKFSR